jgi:hypothetical protein
MRLRLLASVAICVLLAVPVLAQEQTGILQGKVVDASGAVLPGVSVTISGPTILGGSRVAVTAGTGTYRLPTIPVGLYAVSFELSGFTTKVYKDVRIDANVTYTLDADLSVGALQTTVTVTGEAPTVDTAATAVDFTFTKDLMVNVPNARDVWDMVTQAPGVSVQGGLNVGGTETGKQLAFAGHGVDSRQNTYELNGADVTDNTNNGGSQFYFDVDSFDEMKVEVNSHGADVKTPGIVLNIVPKSGTNSLHGGGSFYFGNDKMQSNNVDSALMALGVTQASSLHLYSDVGFDLGGPIKHDKVWFYGAFRYQTTQNYITGTENANGTFPIDRTYLWYPSGKVNWQVTPKHNFSAYFNMAQKKRFDEGLSALNPVDTTWDQQGDPIARLFTFRDDWLPSSSLLVSVKVNIMNQGFELVGQPGVNPNTPATYDLATGAWSNNIPYTYGIEKSLRTVDATASYHVDQWLGGQHDLKFGFDLSDYAAWGNQGGTGAVTSYPGDYRMILNNGVPYEVTLYQSGVSWVLNPTRSAFVQDGWKLGRATVNLGVRWDWQANSLKASQAPSSPFFSQAISQPATGNLITWKTWSPRLGFIYDLTGSAKTLVKASYSRYAWNLWTNNGSTLTTTGDRSYTYLWNDLNGDGQFQYPGELGQLVSVVDPSTSPVTADPNLKPTVTNEFTAGVSHELAGNCSVGLTIMYRKDSNLTWVINPAIGPSDYTAVTGTDPLTGAPLTIYNISAADAALSPNYITNRPGFTQEYRGVELTFYRRLANNWQVVGSFTVGKNSYNYGPGSYQDPQDINLMDGQPIPTSLPYIGKLEGSYTFRKGVTLSGFYQYLSGTGYTRTVNSIDALGYSLNQGNVAVLSGPEDATRYPALNLLDLRVSYDLPLWKTHTSLILDVFNALNINTITNTNVLTGSEYGQVLAFVPPRIFRIGLTTHF